MKNLIKNIKGIKRYFSQKSIKGLTKRYFLNNKGQGLIEYAWILVLIAVVVVVMLQFTGKQVENKYSQINSGVTSAMQ